ncbi:MAG: HDOD domain-containing protein [Verrucomicrobiales bacterium]|nr:HDOD domain-containing protein [Verrucomicrobiales bacterium]
MKATPQKDILHAIATLEKLHPSPVILSRAMRLLSDPNSDPASLVEVISTDAAVTTDVLHISNSAYYGVPQQVASLEEAVRFLGYDEVYRMIGLNLSKHFLSSPLDAYGMQAAEFWMESVRAALLMKDLAPDLEVDAATGYTTGLLHTLGRLAINQVLVQLGRRLPVNSHTSSESFEVEHTGLTFAEVGGLLLERWRFPEGTCQAIRCQLDPQRPGDPPLLAGLQLVRSLFLPAPLASEGCLTEIADRFHLAAEDLQSRRDRCVEEARHLHQCLGLT